jgi:hypothetical protein
LEVILSQEYDLILRMNEGCWLGLLLDISGFFLLDFSIHSGRFVGLDIFPEDNAVGIERPTNQVEPFHEVVHLGEDVCVGNFRA